jgi:hypothetical protein
LRQKYFPDCIALHGSQDKKIVENNPSLVNIARFSSCAQTLILLLEMTRIIGLTDLISLDFKQIVDAKRLTNFLK